jgi:hypothetical protein
MKGKFQIHELTPLKTAKTLKNIAVFDIETTEWIDDTYGMTKDEVMKWHNKPIIPFLAMFYDGKKIKYYEGKECISKFLKDYLHDKNRGYITFAHNGGKFDFIALYQALVDDDYLAERFQPKPVLAHGSIMALNIRDDYKHAWHFRDSYMLMRDSLDNLCKSFKPDHVKLLRPKICYEDDKEKWKRYCANDCKSLYEILKIFNQIIMDVGGSIGYTAPSTAMQTFRKKFLLNPIPVYFQYNNIFRNAYYGGRVEVINMLAQETGHPYYYYDVNSEYPDVMAKNIFPVSKPRSVRYKDPDECFGKCGIMECHVKAPEHLDIPILPYHDPERVKLLFPLGEWDGFYEFSLIEKALLNNYEITPKRIWEFDGEKIFWEYITRFYTLKQQSTGAERTIMKLLMNSLYGKFGEKQQREELITDPNEDITGSLPYDNIFGYSIRKYERFSCYHLPAIACRVTSLAQLKLYSYIEEIQRKNGKIYYMDTDSIVTDVRIPTGSGLGELKLEHEIQKAVFIAPKTYILHTYDLDNPYKVVMKGYTKHFTKHFTYEDFEEALLTGNYEKFCEWQIQPASLKKINIRSLNGFVTMVEPQTIRSAYDKREVMPDYSTRPWKI